MNDEGRERNDDCLPEPAPQGGGNNNQQVNGHYNRGQQAGPMCECGQQTDDSDSKTALEREKQHALPEPADYHACWTVAAGQPDPLHRSYLYYVENT
jgi:hypothetical protein